MMAGAVLNGAILSAYLPEAALPLSVQLAWVVLGYMWYRRGDRILLRPFVL